MFGKYIGFPPVVVFFKYLGIHNTPRNVTIASSFIKPAHKLDQACWLRPTSEMTCDQKENQSTRYVSGHTALKALKLASFIIHF